MVWLSSDIMGKPWFTMVCFWNPGWFTNDYSALICFSKYSCSYVGTWLTRGGARQERSQLWVAQYLKKKKLDIYILFFSPVETECSLLYHSPFFHFIITTTALWGRVRLRGSNPRPPWELLWQRRRFKPGSPSPWPLHLTLKTKMGLRQDTGHHITM